MRLWVWGIIGLTAFIVLSRWRATRRSPPLLRIFLAWVLVLTVMGLWRSLGPTPPAQVPTPSATPEPGPRGRPPHLLGHMPDGTRVQVVVSDGEDGKEPEDVLQTWERGLKTGREDDSPRHDGALVFVDLATHRAWFRFGPELRVVAAPPPDLSLENAWTPWTNPSFAAPPPEPRGERRDGCALVALPEAASLLGSSLELDARPPHDSRAGAPLSCAYSGLSTRWPQRPRYEVEIQVAERLPEPERWQPIPGEPEGRRWRIERNDRGVSVAATTAHGLSVVARVARRDISALSARTELELLTAYHFARLLSLRAQDLTPEELRR